MWGSRKIPTPFPSEGLGKARSTGPDRRADPDDPLDPKEMDQSGRDRADEPSVLAPPLSGRDQIRPERGQHVQHILHQIANQDLVRGRY